MIRFAGNTRAPLAVAATLILAACGSSTGTNTDTGAITLSLSPTAASVQQGDSTRVTGSIVRSGGFTGDVNINVTGVPAGVTGTVISPATNGSASATVSIAVASTTVPGPYTLVVQASGSGVTAVSQTFTLTVTAAPPPPPTPAYGFTLGNSTLSVTAGATANTTVTLTRTNFTGGVTFVVDSLPSGVTAAASPNPATANTTTVTFTAAASASPGTKTVMVHGSATGPADVSLPLVLTVNPAPSFTLAALPTTVSIVQGATATAVITATRTGGFTGTIAYISASSPSGLTSALTGTSGDSPTLTVSPLSTLAPGPYTITVTGTSGTITQQTTVSVTVTAAPTIRLDFSACPSSAKPVWLAYQDGTGPFTHVTGAGDVYTLPRFNASKGAIVIVTAPESTYVVTTAVHYLSQAELNAYSGACGPTTPTGNTLTGSVAGVGGSQSWSVSLGGATAAYPANVANFQLANVLPGSRDLVGYRNTGVLPSANDRIVIHRDQNIAAGGTTGVIDFGAGEAVAPVAANITVTGGATNSYYPILNYLTGAACDVGALAYINAGVPSPIALFGVPAPLQRPTDFHQLELFQGGTGGTDGRTVYTSFHTMADRTVAIGSGVGPLVFTTPAGSYKRYQAMFTLSPDYATVKLDYQGISIPANYARLVVDQSAGYLGGSTAVTLAAPDLSAVAGWQATYAPATGTPLQYNVTVSSPVPATFCAEGATLRTASYGAGGV